MWDVTLLQILGIMIVAGSAGLLLLWRFNVPSIVVYIVVGLILGPVLNLVPAYALDPTDPAEAINFILEAGIALLLFLVGLEMSVRKIRDVGRVSIVAGLAQVGITGGIGFVLVMVLGLPARINVPGIGGFTWVEALFIAVALTNSSTVLAVKLLQQKGQTNAIYGHIAVGMNLAKDLALIVVLTLLAAWAGDRDGGAGALGARLALALAGMGLMLGFALVASRYLLAWPFQWAGRSPQTLLIWSLCWCFLFVAAAELVGLSPAIGAFIAGLALAQLPTADDLRRRVHPLMSFFLAVFFISIGVQMELTALAHYWLAIAVICIFVLIGIPIICMTIIPLAGYSKRTAFLAGIAMAQVSELSFVFVLVGVETGQLDQRMMSLVALTGLITIIASSYMILHNERLYEWVERRGLLNVFPGVPRLSNEDAPKSPLHGHIIVIGMNVLGRRIAFELGERGHPVLALDTDPLKLEGLNCWTMVGNIDYGSTVDEVKLPDAALVVSALQIEDTNKLLVYRCKELNVPCAIHAFDDTVMEDLKGLDVEYLIDSKTQGSERLSAAVGQLGSEQ